MKLKLDEIKKMIKEAIDLNSVNWEEFIDNTYSQFKQLEKDYNEKSLDQLKYNHELSNIFDKATEISNSFKQLKNEFDDTYADLDDDQYNNYSDIDNRLNSLDNLIDFFIEDLQVMVDAFSMIGDSDRTNHFSKLSVY